MAKGGWREFDTSASSLPIEEGLSSTPKKQMSVRVQKTKSGKSGKVVTLIKGLDLEDTEIKNLLKLLKIKCGTGGTRKTDHLELQGDQVDIAIDILRTQGYSPKRSGG